MRKLIYIFIALGVFIAILSVSNQKGDTQSISVLRERCSTPYEATGLIRKDCIDLINQTLKAGGRPSHQTPDGEGRVLWQ